MRISIGACVFDSARRVLERDGRPVHLSPKAFALLEILVSERPHAVSRRVLLDRVWPDVTVEEQNVKNLIVEIRAGLGADRGAVVTLPRFGYALTGEATSDLNARLVSATHSYPLVFGENVIGRDTLCAVSLPVTGVSRRHARIAVGGASATLSDLGSKNGTWCNGERIVTEVELRDGDSVRIGIVTLTYRVGTELSETTTLSGSLRDALTPLH